MSLLSYVSNESLVFFLGRNVSNLSQSNFVFLFVCSDKTINILTGILFFEKITVSVSS